MSGRHIARALVAAVLGLGCVVGGTHAVLSDSLDALDAAVKKLSHKPLPYKGVGPAGFSAQVDSDVKRQKEEAAESLNKTLREQGEQTRTRALESGRSILIVP